MTAQEAAINVKLALLELVEAMNVAGRHGVKIEFNIETDGVTLQSKVGRFAAYGAIKLEN